MVKVVERLLEVPGSNPGDARQKKQRSSSELTQRIHPHHTHNT